MANLRFSPGLLSSIRDFGSSLTEAPASRANTLTGAGVQPASLGGMLARNVGGLMGRDMRTPQEKLQAELKGVEDKTSVAGLQKQAQIFANLGTPQAIELALQLQNRAAALSKTQTDAENLRKARVQITQTLGELGLKKERKLFTGGGLDVQDAQDVIKKEMERRALERSDQEGTFKSRKTKVAVADGMKASPEFIARVADGDFDDYSAKDFQSYLEDVEGLGEGANKQADSSFTSQNWVVTKDGGDEQEIGLEFDSKTGKYRTELAGDDKLYTQSQLKNKFGIDLVRKAGAAGGTRTSPFTTGKLSAPQRATLSSAKGAVSRVAGILSELPDTASRLRVYGLAALDPIRFAASLTDFGEKEAELATNLQRAQASITESVIRALSGAAVKEVEYERANKLLVPEFIDQASPNAFVEKMINTYAIIDEMTNMGLKGDMAMDFISARTSSIAADPITNEVAAAIAEGDYRKAVELRTGARENDLDAQVDAILSQF